MKYYVYLFQNKDIFNIGFSNNLENAKKKLTPGELLAYLKTDDPDTICKKLYLRYSETRIPQSDYFRLSKPQVLDCKLMLQEVGGKDYFQPFFRGITLFITILLSWVLISFLIINFGIDPIFEKFNL